MEMVLMVMLMMVMMVMLIGDYNAGILAAGPRGLGGCGGHDARPAPIGMEW
jgi:hypothetical protein